MQRLAAPYGNGLGGFSNVTIGTGVAFTAGTLSATGSGGTVTSVSGTTGRITSTGGATPVIDLASGVATPGTTGSSTLVPVVTIDTYGRVTSITTAANPQGTVTSVGGTGTVNGLTLTGTVTSSGNLTLGGTLDLSSPPAIGATAPSTGKFTTLTGTGLATLGSSTGVKVQIDRASDDTSYGLITLNGAFASSTTSGLYGRNAGGDAGKLYITGITNVFLQIAGATAVTVSSTGLTTAGTISPQQATTAAAPTYVKGAIYFDTTLNKLRVGGAAGWETITSV